MCPVARGMPAANWSIYRGHLTEFLRGSNMCRGEMLFECARNCEPRTQGAAGLMDCFPPPWLKASAAAAAPAPPSPAKAQSTELWLGLCDCAKEDAFTNVAPECTATNIVPFGATPTD